MQGHALRPLSVVRQACIRANLGPFAILLEDRVQVLYDRHSVRLPFGLQRVSQPACQCFGQWNRFLSKVSAHRDDALVLEC